MIYGRTVETISHQMEEPSGIPKCKSFWLIFFLQKNANRSKPKLFAGMGPLKLIYHFKKYSVQFLKEIDTFHFIFNYIFG